MGFVKPVIFDLNDLRGRIRLYYNFFVNGQLYKTDSGS